MRMADTTVIGAVKRLFKDKTCVSGVMNGLKNISRQNRKMMFISGLLSHIKRSKRMYEGRYTSFRPSKKIVWDKDEVISVIIIVAMDLFGLWVCWIL